MQILTNGKSRNSNNASWSGIESIKHTHTHTASVNKIPTFSANTEHQARGKDPEIPTKDIKLDLFSKLNQINPVGISDVDGNSGRKACKCCDCCRDAHWPAEVGCLVECLTCYYWAWSSSLSIQLSIYLWQKQEDLNDNTDNMLSCERRRWVGWRRGGTSEALEPIWGPCDAKPVLGNRQFPWQRRAAKVPCWQMTAPLSSVLALRRVCFCLCVLVCMYAVGQGYHKQKHTHTYIWPIWNLLKNSFAWNKTDIEKSLTAKIPEMNILKVTSETRRPT